ncbi:Domain of uncharacterised function (DUF477) [Cardiobacterium hominis]|uniref:TPM domain-containing protein n=1 Tax=Cardiobacterium hominis (strain ATCC 15826 / DSM 8339 / NCTC 10426 / 6573) TaxID=638300 RepID=C8N699_CARH6|nr:TPM domain-containing protein [Cardiobacterium hominis]EEV89840.1 hypothetical protein HMPREF0198_0012 [Cardiobacterium hominis ATCC 15826]VEG76652.1 Domain of uncharacterised function (DUF477) [Cardiobacterium hominis]
MKRWLLLLALLAGVAHAIAPDKLTLGKEPVVDQAAMLAPAETAALNQKLRTLHEAQVMQGAIVLIDNLNGMSDFDYGMAVFQRWQLGDRTRNDGLLILLSEKEHAIRIITGRGIEGDIPDAFAKKVINGMVPSFKQGRFAAGLNKGVDEIAARLQTDPAERLALAGHTDDAGHTADAFSETTGMLTFLLTFVGRLPAHPDAHCAAGAGRGRLLPHRPRPAAGSYHRPCRLHRRGLITRHLPRTHAREKRRGRLRR